MPSASLVTSQKVQSRHLLLDGAPLDHNDLLFNEFVTVEGEQGGDDPGVASQDWAAGCLDFLRQPLVVTRTVWRPVGSPETLLLGGLPGLGEGDRVAGIGDG